MQKNIAGQKWIVFAFNLTNNTPVTGNALNITANLRIDGGAVNAVDDVNPTELEDGFYVFDLTQVETNGDMILISPASITADVQVIGVPAVVYTTAPNLNKLSIESDGDLTKVNLCDVNTDMRGTDNAALATGVQLSTQGKADVNNEVKDVLNIDANVELASIPNTATTMQKMIQFLFQYFRNKRTVSSTTETMYKEDASTSLGTAAISDDGTIFTKGEAN